MGNNGEKPPKIFVVFTDGSVGQYRSEAPALSAIREREHQGSEVVMVIIGWKLGMVKEKCDVIHCFTTIGIARKLNR